ncbi:UvrD-helicase domain-containing protein [Aureispira anguillae]|uniref:DNA 3'-5' helicase II n=1 Tax=Aureispira anguillae TaxID=2864201 RepID=A0A915YDC0_9BACT|nr:UvrD-helicase domain-containing protein [Aureispira anguillae]BDS10980.1 UvrD-helicase domain-containing protein [Aureispira anguillae]
MFNINGIVITDEEIAEVELHFGFQFNERQREVIKFWDSTDVQACPGSGKTTTLAAKLMILAKKIPKSFKHGICVITHTNIAVKEIKDRLGIYANYYSEYPNHFGTIQSFVDKYLTIPAYKEHYQHSPVLLDEFEWINLLKRQPDYNRLVTQSSYISQRHIKVNELVFNKSNFNISTSINKAQPFLGKTTVTYRSVRTLKERLLKEGYIKYNEAYSIAFSYLRKHPEIKQLFSYRFPIVFIDEMQDMETHQYQLIDELFKDRAIVQKIGDINQSIFSNTSNQEMNIWQPNSVIQLIETTRLNNTLSKIIKPVCMSPQAMESNWNPYPLIKPTILVFNDSNISRVKDKYIDLIIQYNLQNQGNRIFKAIGHIKSNPRLGIVSYWSDFNKDNLKDRNEYDNLVSYVDKFRTLINNKNVKEPRKTLLELICKSLKIAGIKNPQSSSYFTPFTLINFLLEERQPELKELNENLVIWILKFKKNLISIPILVLELKQYIISLVHSFGKKVSNTELQNFINAPNSQFSQTVPESNQLYNNQGLTVHFDTIHGVKGETHTATLFLETYHNTFDIGSKILDFISSSSSKQNSLRTRQSYKSWQRKLPLSYVAISRATHFLCLAVHEDRFQSTIQSYFQSNQDWEVVYV